MAVATKPAPVKVQPPPEWFHSTQAADETMIPTATPEMKTTAKKKAAETFGKVDGGVRPLKKRRLQQNSPHKDAAQPVPAVVVAAAHVSDDEDEFSSRSTAPRVAVAVPSSLRTAAAAAASPTGPSSKPPIARRRQRVNLSENNEQPEPEQHSGIYYDGVEVSPSSSPAMLPHLHPLMVFEAGRPVCSPLPLEVRVRHSCRPMPSQPALPPFQQASPWPIQATGGSQVRAEQSRRSSETGFASGCHIRAGCADDIGKTQRLLAYLARRRRRVDVPARLSLEAAKPKTHRAPHPRKTTALFSKRVPPRRLQSSRLMPTVAPSPTSSAPIVPALPKAISASFDLEAPAHVPVPAMSLNGQERPEADVLDAALALASLVPAKAQPYRL